MCWNNSLNEKAMIHQNIFANSFFCNLKFSVYFWEMIWFTNHSISFYFSYDSLMGKFTFNHLNILKEFNYMSTAKFLLLSKILGHYKSFMPSKSMPQKAIMIFKKISLYSGGYTRTHSYHRHLIQKPVFLPYASVLRVRHIT